MGTGVRGETPSITRLCTTFCRCVTRFTHMRTRAANWTEQPPKENRCVSRCESGRWILRTELGAAAGRWTVSAVMPADDRGATLCRTGFPRIRWPLLGLSAQKSAPEQRNRSASSFRIQLQPPTPCPSRHLTTIDALHHLWYNMSIDIASILHNCQLSICASLCELLTTASQPTG